MFRQVRGSDAVLFEADRTDKGENGRRDGGRGGGGRWERERERERERVRERV